MIHSILFIFLLFSGITQPNNDESKNSFSLTTYILFIHDQKTGNDLVACLEYQENTSEIRLEKINCEHNENAYTLFEGMAQLPESKPFLHELPLVHENNNCFVKIATSTGLNTHHTVLIICPDDLVITKAYLFTYQENIHQEDDSFSNTNETTPAGHNTNKSTVSFNDFDEFPDELPNILYRSPRKHSFLSDIKRGFLIYYYGITDYINETIKEHSPFK